jgi:hypothetical protein
MSVHRYNELAQKTLQSRTAPEAWLHFASVAIGDGKVIYAIFVWDTRQVIEQGTAKLNGKDYIQFLQSVPAAKDNGQPLKNLSFSEPYQSWLKREIEASNAVSKLFKHAKGTANIKFIDR